MGKKANKKTIVIKYGGTSVKDAKRIKNVARIATKYLKKGYGVVVVVSAMAGVTNKLIDLAHEITSAPNEREMDLLLSSGERISSAAIQALGYQSISLTGRQVGILTDSVHTKAMIERINTDRIIKELNEGKIPVVAGFQGIDKFSEVTTLGRGGSDTTAVAIAAALKAECVIYTDVEGVFTADPNILPKAKKLDRISYEDMLEMASLGAKVLHSRAVEIAKKYNVPLVVRSSFKNKPGTLITKGWKGMEKIVVTGISHDKNQTRITIAGVHDVPGIAARVFKTIADENINVDMIVQNVSSKNKSTDISFTVKKTNSKKALQITKGISKKLRARGATIMSNVAKVSIVGVGMISHFGVAAKMFEVLAKHKINILMISTSEMKVSCLINIQNTEKAVKVLHKAFNVGE
jgi:aspartate kinase